MRPLLSRWRRTPSCVHLSLRYTRERGHIQLDAPTSLLPTATGLRLDSPRQVRMTKRQPIEEPYDGKLSRTVLYPTRRAHPPPSPSHLSSVTTNPRIRV